MTTLVEQLESIGLLIDEGTQALAISLGRTYDAREEILQAKTILERKIDEYTINGLEGANAPERKAALATLVRPEQDRLQETEVDLRKAKHLQELVEIMVKSHIYRLRVIEAIIASP